MKYSKKITDLIGRTPLVRLDRINPYNEVTLLAKLEYMNPGGSVKDRAALYMLQDAQKRGLLSQDTTIVEATSGNTGIGLAMVCAVEGYQCMIVMPESASYERRKIIESYGALVVLTSADDGMDGAVDYVHRLCMHSPKKYLYLNQYDNPANWLGHYETTGQELIEDTHGSISHFVAGLGTSGTLMGVSKKLKESIGAITIVSVEPTEGSNIPGLRSPTSRHSLGILDETLIDYRINVDEENAKRMTRLLATREGLFVGQSSGAALEGALRLATRLVRRGEENLVIVVLFPDSGNRYLTTLAKESSI